MGLEVFLFFCVAMVLLAFKLSFMYFLVIIELVFMVITFFCVVFCVKIWFSVILLSVSVCEGVMGVGLLIMMSLYNGGYYKK